MFRDDFITTRGPNHRGSPAAAAEAAWSRSQDKLFEQALVVFPDETPDRWARIAAQVPGKSAWEVREHYEALLHDVYEIDSGRVEVPRYAGEPSWVVDDRIGSGQSQISFGGSGRGKAAEGATERKKGVPWTEEEHRQGYFRHFTPFSSAFHGLDAHLELLLPKRRIYPLPFAFKAFVGASAFSGHLGGILLHLDAVTHQLFLIGLQKYGRGDWRSISRNAVVSRTPTQVASHAQKYYLRLNSVKKEKKRSSIHDITTVNGVPASEPSEGWGGSTPAAAGPHPGMLDQSQQVDRAFMSQSSGQGSYGYQHFGLYSIHDTASCPGEHWLVGIPHVQ
ncbi:hypothetical protein ACLOJK_005898 [Asimina triloba]